MRTEEVLALGKISPEDLVVSVGESTRKINPEIESQVDTLWEKKKARADAEGRVCFNGITYRLNSLREQGGKTIIDFGLLEFKARSTLWSIPGYKELPTEYYHKGCYTGATVKTSDGRYLVVELSGKSMNTHSMDMLGGIIEKPSEIEMGSDIFECLYVELEEEARVTKTDIDQMYLRSIFITQNTHTCFYFEVTLRTSSKELLERVSNEAKDQDIKSVKALSEEEYQAFLADHSSASKQFIAGIRQI